MTNLEYKGYVASLSYSAEDEVFVGKVDQIEGLIMFAADNVKDLVASFHEAIDQYLAVCAASGVVAEKAYKGSFNVRVGSDRHRRAALNAKRRGVSLNDYVGMALDQLEDRSRQLPAAKHSLEINRPKQVAPISPYTTEEPFSGSPQVWQH